MAAIKVVQDYSQILPPLESLSGIDWTAHKPFKCYGEPVLMDCETLLASSCRLFYSAFFRWSARFECDRDDCWQAWSMFVMRLYAGVGLSGDYIPFLMGCCSHFIRDFFVRQCRNYWRELPLEIPNPDDGSVLSYLDQEDLAWFDSYFERSLDWSAFTDEENALIDQILSGNRRYSRRTALYFGLCNKLEQHLLGEPMTGKPLTARQLALVADGNKYLRNSQTDSRKACYKRAKERRRIKRINETPAEREARLIKQRERNRRHRERHRYELNEANRILYAQNLEESRSRCRNRNRAYRARQKAARMEETA
jgi:hypothetical protein